MRQSVIVPFELKKTADASGALTFDGYGSVFNTIDSYDDTIAKGAFLASLRAWKAKGKLPKMLLQHGGGFFGGGAEDLVPIGKWTAMSEDDYGLSVSGQLFSVDTDRARSTTAAVREGELDGLSIGFRTVKSAVDEQTGIRTISEIDLWEVSLVTFPANDPARLTGIKADGAVPSERELERFLREAGFSRDQAKGFLAKGYAGLRREAAGAPDPAALQALLDGFTRRAAIFQGDARS